MKPRKCIAELEPYGYVPADADIAGKYGLKVSDIKRFDRNTSPLVLKAVDAEFKKIIANGIVNEYPDSRYLELTRLLSEYMDVAPKQIVLGNGADEVIDMLARTYLSSGDTAVCSTPTFSFYKVVVSMAGGKFIEVPRNDKDFSPDIEKLLDVSAKANASMMFICNPNNPTADIVPQKDIERLVKGFKGIVVVDEAYAEFSGEMSAAALCMNYSNVVVIRTMSKAFGLAGMRVGYAICSPNISGQLNKVRQPYNINPVSERLAIAAVKSVDEMKANVREIVKERNRMASELKKLGFTVFESSTNFLVVRTSVQDAERIFETLAERGLILRKLSGIPGVLRITLRTAEDNELLLRELKAIYDAIIFDIDGVLVDVSKSYREAIRRTAEELSGRTITDADVDALKSLPGSNNDWDVTYALVKGTRNLKDIDRNDEEYKAVKQRFQELYLGSLRDQEKLLISQSTLEKLLKQGYKLGIVTSRPRDEALYALRQFIPEFFPEAFIIAQEDCTAEKPDPAPIILAMQKLGCRAAVYVGDSINDAMAAKAAGMKFVSVQPDIDADYMIDDVNKIQEVLK